MTSPVSSVTGSKCIWKLRIVLSTFYQSPFCKYFDHSLNNFTIVLWTGGELLNAVFHSIFSLLAVHFVIAQLTIANLTCSRYFASSYWSSDASPIFRGVCSVCPLRWGGRAKSGGISPELVTCSRVFEHGFGTAWYVCKHLSQSARPLLLSAT